MDILFTIGMNVLIRPVALILATFSGYATLRTVWGTDVEIISHFWGDIRMIYHADNNCNWTKTIRIERGRSSDKDLPIIDPLFCSSATPNL